MRPPVIETKLTKLAEKLLDSALDPQPRPFWPPVDGEKPEPRLDPVDVFKAVSTWYLASSKAKGKEPPDVTGSFAALKKSLNGTAETLSRDN
jgi:hypothetical protein